MSDNSTIEWTDATWNPIRATKGGVLGRHYCELISPGCDHCYASTMTRRLAGYSYLAVSDKGLPGAKVPGVRPTLDQKALEEPLHWAKPRRIFVCSMTDLFGEWVPPEWIAAIFAVMESAHQHTYQVLTKRPRQMHAILTRSFYAGAVRKAGYDALGSLYRPHNPGWPLPNVWLGVTVEEDRYAWRAAVLSRIPAAVRFVSAEPLLGPLPTLPLVPCECPSCGKWHLGPCDVPYRAIDWVIAGGESGHGARPPHPDWFRDLRDRCTAAGVAYFFKQWGAWAPSYFGEGREPASQAFRYLDDPPVKVWRFGKKAAGRLLDGRTWDEMPQVAEVARV